jgi:HD-like signal output (HDOD) protein
MVRTAARAPDYGRGIVEIDDDGGDLLLGADELIEIIDAPGYQPPVLPVIALQLYELARQPDLDYRRVLRLLEREPLVAARILRLAQSPMYAARVPVASLADALNRLGIEALARIVLEATAGLTLFRAPGYEAAMDSMRRHSTATAYLARAIAHAIRQPTELAFLCGLLHDVGVVACLVVYARPRRGRTPPAFDLVWPVIEPLHQAVSSRLGRLWNLPSPVQQVIADHHLHAPTPKLDPIAGAVFLADTLACELGVGHEAAPESTIVAAVREAIGFPPAALDDLMAYGREVVSAIE